MDTDRDIERLSVTEAARRLDISESALRKRIQRGQVAVERDGHTVWVLLPRPDSATGPGPDDQAPGPDQSQAESTAAADVSGLMARVETLERLVATQADVIATLEHHLAVRAREVEQLHVLLSQAQQLAGRAPELPESSTPTRRPWWRRWWRA